MIPLMHVPTALDTKTRSFEAHEANGLFFVYFAASSLRVEYPSGRDRE